LKLFLKAFVYSMPSGHATTFAHRTLPHAVCIAIRDNQPVNLVSAFESPVRSNGGIAPESVRRMAVELQRTADLWGVMPVRVLATYEPASDGDTSKVLHDVLGEPLPFGQVVEQTCATVLDLLSAKAE
jgi:CRISPR system Cascade subunit CasC